MATYHHTIEATGAPSIATDGLNKPAGSITPSTPDLRRLAGGPVRAESAAQAADRLAKRVFGKQGRVESLVYVARTWKPNEFGGGAIVGKSWAAVLVLAPTAEQQYWGNINGQHYQRAALPIVITEGSISGNDTPAASRWPARPIPELLGLGTAGMRKPGMHGVRRDPKA